MESRILVLLLAVGAALTALTGCGSVPVAQQDGEQPAPGLAAESVTVSGFTASSSWTLPTMATLFTLLTGNGLEDSDAVLLAAAIMDWKDPDEMERPDGAELETYESAGLGVGPGNRPFVMTEELLQVIGMSWDLFTSMEPGLTVFSDAAQPNPAYAPVEALLALPEVTEADARNFVADRHSQETLDGQGAALPGGQTAMARGMGSTYSILAKATLPNGVWDQIETTIRLGAGPDGLPYRILRWREGFHH